MPNPTYTDAQLIEDMKRVSAKYGHLTKNIYDDFGGMATTVVIRRFGSWNAALQAAGMPLSHEQGNGKWKRNPDMVQQEPKRRLCLKCGKEFTSKWNGHRRCDRCVRYAEEIMNIAEGFEECA